MPGAFAFSAMRLPITAAAALLPPFFRSLRTSASSVEALASTLSPVGRDDLRVDVAVRAADDEARRALLGDAHPGLARAADSSFFFIHRYLSSPFDLESSGSARDSRVN